MIWSLHRYAQDIIKDVTTKKKIITATLQPTANLQKPTNSFSKLFSKIFKSIETYWGWFTLLLLIKMKKWNIVAVGDDNLSTTMEEPSELFTTNNLNGSNANDNNARFMKFIENHMAEILRKTNSRGINCSIW